MPRAGKWFSTAPVRPSKLDDGQKAGLSREKAIALMLEQPSMIKRPVLEAKGKITVGFKPETYQTLLRDCNLPCPKQPAPPRC